MQANQQKTFAVKPVLAAALLGALLLSPPVHAQEPVMKKAPSVKGATAKSKANLMTRAELRTCMNEQDRLQSMRGRIEQEQAGLDQQKARVLAMNDELKKKVATLDPADEAARKTLEGEGVKADEAADAYNARLATLRQQAQSFDDDRKAWVDRCTKKDFDEMDEAAIKKERQQAAGKKK